MDKGARLPLEDLRRLNLRSHDWLRLDFQGATSIGSDALLRGQFRGLLPLNAVVGQPGKIGDLVGTFCATVYAMTSGLRLALEKAGLTGWVPYPVRMRTAVENELFEASFPYLDPMEWNGIDLFMPRVAVSLAAAVALNVVASFVVAWSAGPAPARQAGIWPNGVSQGALLVNFWPNAQVGSDDRTL